jgi:Ca-activated chloride channel family protein
MKKGILILGSFLILAAVAVLFAFQSRTQKLEPVVVKVDPVAITPASPLGTSPVPSAISKSNVLFEWRLGNPYLLRGSEGDVYLDLRVSGKALANNNRKPMNLVLVIDRSGSMGSENKLEKVKEAAGAIIDNMNPTDRLAIVIYDDQVQTLYPSSPVENKARLREAIYSLSPGGSTNLFGGLEAGFEEARRNFNRAYVNRIVLLSDGLANVGVIDPNQIAAEAKRIRENNISISSMGVGIDYNENLMANIADNSGGNYYYISQELNMAEVFRKEWNLMQSMVANNAHAVLDLGPNVSVIDVAGFTWNQSGRRLTVQVPDLYSGQTKRILVHLRAPVDGTKLVDLGEGRLVCTDISQKTPQAYSFNFHPTIKVVEDQTLVAKNYDNDVQSKVASVNASKKMEQAYQLMEVGNLQEAQKVATSANDELKSLGYVSNAPQAARYEELLKGLASGQADKEDGRKDILKRQKAAERDAQQSNAQ